MVPLVEDSEESDLLEDNIVCCVPLVVDEQEDEVEELEGKEEEEEVEGRRYLLSFVEPELMERSRGNSWSRIFIALALKSFLFRQEVGIFFLKETLVDKKKQLKVVLILPELILIGPIPLNWSCERESTGKCDILFQTIGDGVKSIFICQKIHFNILLMSMCQKIHLNVSNNTSDFLFII